MVRRKSGRETAKRWNKRAFPLRGRWRGEAVTDEVATKKLKQAALLSKNEKVTVLSKATKKLKRNRPEGG